MEINYKKNYFLISLTAIILTLLLIAIADLQTYPLNFWILAYAAAIIICIMYFAFTRKIIEAIGLFAVWFIMFLAGLEDLLFYIISSFPASMPHLYDEPIMGMVAMLIGLQTVTPFSLIISVLIGGIIAFFVMFFARKIQKTPRRKRIKPNKKFSKN